MRSLILMMLLGNIGLYAYFNRTLFLPAPASQQLAEIEPEKVVIFNPQQIEALPKKAAVAPPALILDPIVTTCHEWGVFTGANQTRAEQAIKALGLSFTVTPQSSSQAKRFWVYRQPLPNAEAAQAKVVELKALGVEDLFVVQEPKWKFAISFGVFEDEQLATKLLNDLKAKGVKNVTKSIRNQGKEAASFKIMGLTESNLQAVEKLQPDFPEATLNEVGCGN